MQKLIIWYLRWRYGGNVSALKPPLGYSEHSSRPLWYRIWYKCFLYPRWRLENRLFKQYGEPMRREWFLSLMQIFDHPEDLK
jgi:hypothetical protein